ncbi:lysophospholipid acyltransferase family protein [Planctomycetota bacterium]
MIAHRNFLKDICRLLFWFPLRWCVYAAPFPFIYHLGGLLGRTDYHFSGGRRVRNMSANICEAFGCTPKQARKTILQNLQNHCRNVLELMKYPQVSCQTMQRILYFDRIHHLENEMKRGKGVILLTAHFGAKQVLQVALGLKGYRVNQIHYHMSHEELSWIQKHISQRQRVKIENQIPTTFIPAKGFMRSAYKCLMRNEILIIAGDGIGLKTHMDKSYLPFNFLGKKMLFPTGMISLAKKTSASILPVFVVREKSKHKIVIEPPINTEHDTDTDPITEYVRVFEKYIRQYPSLWEFWEEFEQGNLIAVPDSSNPNCQI